jgi:hypothetical protein
MQGGAEVLTLVNSTFLFNTTSDSDNPLGEIEGGAVVVNAGQKTIFNNVFGDNVGTSGGGGLTVGPLTGGSTIIVGNVLLYNDSPQGAGIHFEAFSAVGSTPLVVNNIIAFNQGYGVWSDLAVYPTGFQYNDVFGNTSGAYGAPIGPIVLPTNNIASDPTFVELTDDGDWTDDDLALDAGSPCIDTGDPRPAFDDPDGSPSDMGIYGGPAGDWSWPIDP